MNVFQATRVVKISGSSFEIEFRRNLEPTFLNVRITSIPDLFPLNDETLKTRMSTNEAYGSRQDIRFSVPMLAAE